jgi:predicted DNA-binding transcriptional regulator YafY
MRQRILIDPSWWWQDSHQPVFWEMLQAAVYEDSRVRARYERYDGELVTRTLEPYSLIAKSSIWYLVARREGEFRTYRVTRFHDLEILDEHFTRDPGYDLPTFWQSHLQAFVESMAECSITLEVHPDRVGFVQWLTPGRHQVTEPASAGDWYKVRVQIESLELAKMLVFGLGAQARVIEPRALYDAVVEAAREFCPPLAQESPTLPSESRKLAWQGGNALL